VGLWHSVRREVAGAWRSARYDVDRRVGAHRQQRFAQAETAELVRQVVWRRPAAHRRGPGEAPSPRRRTPAEMAAINAAMHIEMPWAGRRSTEGSPATGTPRHAQGPATPPWEQPQQKPVHRRRKVAAAAGIGMLVAGGAAGTYLAVAGTLVGVIPDGSDGTVPPVAAPALPGVPSGASPQENQAGPNNHPADHAPRAAAPAPISVDDDSRAALPVSTPAPRVPESTPTAPTSPAPTPSLSVTPSHSPTAVPTPSAPPSAPPREMASPSASASVSSASDDADGPDGSDWHHFRGRHHQMRPGQTGTGR
jgi:hypothetical protein